MVLIDMSTESQESCSGNIFITCWGAEVQIKCIAMSKLVNSQPGISFRGKLESSTHSKLDFFNSVFDCQYPRQRLGYTWFRLAWVVDHWKTKNS